MKILQINNCHYRRGGADVVYINTGKLLEDNGHEVFYFSQLSKNNLYSKTSKYFIKETNFFAKSLTKKILSIPRFFYSIEAKNNISKLISENKPDIAHLHLYKASLTPSILTALKKFKIPIIISLHDLGLLCPHNLMLDGSMRLCSRCVNQTPLLCILYKCNRNNLILSVLTSFEYIYQTVFFPFNYYYDRIITLSKFSHNLHTTSNYFHIPIDNLYNFFPNLSNTIPNKKKGSYFLFFGRLSSEKGVKLLIDAWLKKDRKSKLLIVGTGELMDEMQEKTYNTSITLVGFKSGIELINLITNASFVIVPSICYENNPMTIIEAYSYGKPVIGSNIGGIPEIIDNGNTGYLFEMNSIEDLSLKIDIVENIDEKEYDRLSHNARRFADQHFNPESHYNHLIDLYSKTIKNYKEK